MRLPKDQQERETTKTPGLEAKGRRGIQNEATLGVPLWYADCFELKVTKTLRAQEKLTHPLTIWKNLN